MEEIVTTIAQQNELINTIPIIREIVDEVTGETKKEIIEYAPVNERLKAFRRIFPLDHIITEYELDNDYVDFKATILVDKEIIATGHARANVKDFERCETKAIGRALAFAGFNKSNEIASAEEIKEHQEEVKEEKKETPSEKIKKAVKKSKPKGIAKVSKNQLKKLDEIDQEFLNDCLNQLEKPIERLTVDEADEIIKRYEAIV